jgi:hypothetical protein
VGGQAYGQAEVHCVVDANGLPVDYGHHIAGDLRTGVQKLKDATPAGVATALDRLDLIDEYKLLVHPRIAGHGPTLYHSGLPSTRRLELIAAKSLRNGASPCTTGAHIDSMSAAELSRSGVSFSALITNTYVAAKVRLHRRAGIERH